MDSETLVAIRVRSLVKRVITITLTGPFSPIHPKLTIGTAYTSYVSIWARCSFPE